MLSDVQICSAALSLLRCNPVSSLDDEGTQEGIIAKTHYAAERTLLLSRHRWNFAHRVVRLSHLSLKPEDIKYEYAYALPSDCLNVRTMSDSHARIFGDCIYAFEHDLTLEYTEFVREEKTPVWFDEVLKLRLAHVFSVPMTGKIELADYFKNAADEAFAEALRIDAQQARPPAFNLGPIGGSRA